MGDITELKVNGVEVTKVETLSMGPNDVLFVTFDGDISGEAIGFLDEELKALLGHNRFMLLHKTFKLEVVSGKELPAQVVDEG